MAPCPPTRILEAFAVDAAVDEAVAAHIRACAQCRSAIEESRENDNFLAGVRPVLAAQGSGRVEAGLVSGYQIEEEIHRGGQGVVYRAVQTRTRRMVAIKVLLGGGGASGRQKERFEREIRMAAGLRHPNVVTVYESGSISDGRYGLVMEYIEGAPLDKWSRSLDGGRGRDARRRALRERLGVMLKVCDAVLCAHQHSIVHRDLKPANVLVDRKGEPHILDFGIARNTGPDQRTRLTHTGEFAGTLAYASPEQVSGDLSKVDTRTDIYSLGVIMYEVVSGKMPYPVDGPISQVLRGIESADPVPLSRHTRNLDGPWVDGEVSTIILKAMAKDPARRYQTAAELRDDINRYLAGEAIAARRDSTWYLLRKTAARHRIVFTAAGLIFVLLAAFGAAMTYQAHRLDARGRELAAALSDSTIERGRMLAAAGNIPLAEETVWPELIGAGVRRIDGPEVGLIGSPEALRAYWALWDISRRSSCIATLRTHGNEIALLYFDESGRRLCALDNRGNLTAWSVEAWKVVRDMSLVAPIDGVAFHAALAPGGSIGIFGGGTLRLVEPRTGAVEAQADDPDDLALIGAFSPDGTQLVTIGLDDRLRVHNARSLATVATMAESTVCHAYLWFCRPTFSPDGRLVAAARPEGSLGLWSADSGLLERSLSLPDSLKGRDPGALVASSIAFGPDGAIAAALGSHLVVWPADGGAALDLGAPFGPIRCVAFLPGSDGRMLVSSGTTPGGGAGATIIWNLGTGERHATFKHADEMIHCAVSPDCQLIAVGCESGTVRVYEAALEPHLTVLRPTKRRGEIVALSPDGQVLATSDTSGDPAEQGVLLMNLRSGVVIKRIHWKGRLRLLAFTPDGLSLLGGEESGPIMQWDLPTGTVRGEFVFPEVGDRRPGLDESAGYMMRGSDQMRLSPDGMLLARARDDGLIGLWDLPSGQWIGWLDSGSVNGAVIDFSPNGRTLVAHHPERYILWDVVARRPMRTVGTPVAYPSVRFSSNGAVIAHGVNGRIQFLDAGTGGMLSENKDPQSSGLGMAFHPDGSVFFASAFDSSIRLWDTRTGRELLSLQKHTSLVRSLLLTPDGNTLISSDDSGVVLAWDLAYYNERLRRELEYRVSDQARP